MFGQGFSKPPMQQAAMAALQQAYPQLAPRPGPAFLGGAVHPPGVQPQFLGLPQRPPVQNAWLRQGWGYGGPAVHPPRLLGPPMPAPSAPVGPNFLGQAVRRPGY